MRVEFSGERQFEAPRPKELFFLESNESVESQAAFSDYQEGKREWGAGYKYKLINRCGCKTPFYLRTLRTLL
jgi:hypothetical protein